MTKMDIIIIYDETLEQKEDAEDIMTEIKKLFKGDLEDYTYAYSLSFDVKEFDD